MRRALGVLCLSAAGACDLCTITAAQEARTGGLGPALGLMTEWTQTDRLMGPDGPVADPQNQHLTTSTTTVVAGWRWSDALGMRAKLPWIERSWARADRAGIDRGHDRGPGDLLAEVTWTLWRQATSRGSLAGVLFAGIEAPTGASGRLAEESPDPPPSGSRPIPILPRHVPTGDGSGLADVIHGHQLTRGSGSWDGLVGAQLFTSLRRWYVAAHVTGRWNGAGDHGYRFGNSLAWGGGPGCFLWWTDAGTLGLLANCTGHASRHDTVRGARLPHAGGVVVFVGPSLNLTWGSRLTGELGVDLPVLQRVNGIQMADRWRGHAGATWRF
jgi:hypothetical protein